MRWLYGYEVFRIQDSIADTDVYCDPHPDGWYFWVRKPGCLPDTYAAGPFSTECEAMAACQDNIDGFEGEEATEF